MYNEILDARMASDDSPVSSEAPVPTFLWVVTECEFRGQGEEVPLWCFRDNFQNVLFQRGKIGTKTANQASELQ